MDLKTYFEQNHGTGVLATASAAGEVDAAIYSRPHVLADDEVAFIMTDRLSHKNVASNPKATYLFREDRPGYQGVRLFLTRIREETDGEKIQSFRRRTYSDEQEAAMKPLFLVTFKVDRQLPLVGK